MTYPSGVISDQTVKEDTSWSYQLPGWLPWDWTYTATKADGSALPSWIKFNPATRMFTGTPPLNETGSLEIKVSAKEKSKDVGSDTFTLSITPVNDAPVVAVAIADQSVAEDATWAFQVPGNAFSDVDNGSLAYTATLADGSALPSWLAFDAATRTFSGTPPLNQTGTLALKVTASDGTLAASDTFNLAITPVNDAPVVAAPLADQTTAESTPWTFQVPAGAFTDVDSANLAYTATLADGSALPAWLAFNPTNRTFEGTPPIDETGTFTFRVVASDDSLSTSDTFTLTITPVNDEPVVATPIADQSVAEDTAWALQVPAAAFLDSDSSLAYTATLADGSALPAWLSFDPPTRTFEGTPPVNQTGTLALKVTASDGTLSTSDTFNLTITPVNDAPVVAAPLADQTTAESTPWTFQVPAGAFTDVDSANLAYTATLADGSALPAWLAFDAETRTFSGIPPADVTGPLVLKVVASDGFLATSDTFSLTVTPVNDAPVVATPIADQSVAEDTAWAFQVPSDAFSDPDSSLAYTANLASDGSDLPAWLTFNGETRTFSGTPPADATGPLDLKVTASDGSLSVSDTFTLTVRPVGTVPVPEGSYEDLIEGGDGNDWIHGGFGNDEIQGEGGNDTIYGGSDDGAIVRNAVTGKLSEIVIGDNLYGNDGADTYHYAEGDGIDLIWDFRPGEDVIALSGFDPDDIKVTFVTGLTNRITSTDHGKLALIFGNDQGAIVFNDFPGPKSTDVILEVAANGTTERLTWVDLLGRVDLAQADGTTAHGASGGPLGATPGSDGDGSGIFLSGGNGNDILSGGTGPDRLYGNDGYNWLEGFAGNDELAGGNGQDVLLGGDGRDRLYGNEGVNWLEGNAGEDELYGGNIQDTLIAGTENDSVFGNGGDDVIVGGNGSDKLYGAGGADVIYGDDADGLVLTPPARPTIEVASPPAPVSVVTTASFIMSAATRNVTATGKASVTLVGNGLDNVITGNVGQNTIKAGSGNDKINGGYGNDRLYGSSGKDTFIFNSKLGTSTTDRKVNFDTVADYSVKDDTVQLDNAIFKKLGKAGRLNKGFFTVADKAKDKNDYIFYNKKTGVLFYDADGSGSSSKAVEFAKMAANLKLTYADFLTI